MPKALGLLPQSNPDAITARDKMKILIISFEGKTVCPLLRLR